jgi:hypothetical protein
MEVREAAGKKRAILEIAGIRLAMDASGAGPDIEVGGAGERFLVEDGASDVEIQVAWTDRIEDPPGAPAFDSGGPWRMHRDRGGYRFSFRSPALGPEPYKAATFDEEFRRGSISIRRSAFPGSPAVHPLEYPLDELLVVNLLGRGRGVEVHACGLVAPGGEGLLFLGQSGAGKSTMGGLWEAEGGRVLSDDRIVLTDEGGEIWMHGTPWHGTARRSIPEKASLRRAFFLRHAGPEGNSLRPLAPSEAVARLIACGFLPFHSPEAIDLTIRFHESLAARVPCRELSFIPDGGAVRFLLESRGAGG